MWIKKLKLVNFQSHKDTEIDFVNGFNCIVGSSRSGKSSIVRALNFMFFDEWSNTYVRNGADYAAVSILLDNDVYVERRKGSVNEIIVKQPDGTSKVFSTFGIDAPPEVKTLLAVHPVAIDADYTVNINVADQDSPLFLLPASAPAKTKFLNRLTGFHIVDAAIRDIRTEKTYSVNTRKNYVASLVTRQEDLKKYEKLDAIKTSLNTTYAQLETVHKQLERCNTLNAALNKIEGVNKKLTGIKRYMAVYANMKPLVAKLELKFIDAKKLLNLQRALDKLSGVSLDLKNLEEKEAALKQDYKVCPMCLRPWNT